MQLMPSGGILLISSGRINLIRNKKIDPCQYHSLISATFLNWIRLLDPCRVAQDGRQGTWPLSSSFQLVVVIISLNVENCCGFAGPDRSCRPTGWPTAALTTKPSMADSRQRPSRTWWTAPSARTFQWRWPVGRMPCADKFGGLGTATTSATDASTTAQTTDQEVRTRLLSGALWGFFRIDWVSRATAAIWAKNDHSGGLKGSRCCCCWGFLTGWCRLLSSLSGCLTKPFEKNELTSFLYTTQHSEEGATTV